MVLISSHYLDLVRGFSPIGLRGKEICEIDNTIFVSLVKTNKNLLISCKMEFSLLSFSRKTTPKIRLWKTSCSGVRRNVLVCLLQTMTFNKTINKCLNLFFLLNLHYLVGFKRKVIEESTQMHFWVSNL